MTDRPIIFSAPMVRALLAGRKTQTRRVLKPQPRPFECEGRPYWSAVSGIGGRIFVSDADLLAAHRWCVGDRLWVKEAWRIDGAGSRVPAEACLRHGRPVEYRADGYEPTAWMERSPIFMPRRASRLTLLVTDVRVERLQDITEEDAIAEGCGQYASSTRLIEGFDPDRKGSYREGFRELWGVIHGAEAWAANPWIVAVTFSVVERNIDDMPVPVSGAAA